MSGEGDNLIWVDLEMTGLNPETDVILQMAMVVTDFESYQEIDHFEMTVFQPESKLEQMSPFVRKMHERSGLLDQVRRSPMGLDDLAKESVARLLAHTGPKRGYLAGNSVWVDRMFMRQYLPTFEDLLHYRQVDVSSVKILAQSWFGKSVSAPKKNNHTALDDIRESIKELEGYRTLFIRK